MKTRNILTPKFPQIDINKKNIFKATRLLIGLFSLGVCLEAGYGCCMRSYQQKKEIDERDRSTMGVLIDKKIIRANYDKNHVIIWLDTDNNQNTIEGFCNMPDADAEQTLNVSSLTNGTTKSLAEWREITQPYELRHNPCKFLRSR